MLLLRLTICVCLPLPIFSTPTQSRPHQPPYYLPFHQAVIICVVRRIANLFNERWQKEYLATLQSRSKWQQSTPNFYVGQLVLIIDDQEPRRDWKIARVDKIVSEDSHVRRVVVTTADRKSYERHVSKLVTLELDQEETQKNQD